MKNIGNLKLYFAFFSNIFITIGDVCFSGGLLGPDGTNRYLGKWCKRGQNKELKEGSKGLSSNSGDLIAVGADGKGGRVKVLRSLNQSTLVGLYGWFN